MLTPQAKATQLSRDLEILCANRFSRSRPQSHIRLGYAIIDATLQVLMDHDELTSCPSLHLGRPRVLHALLERAVISAIRDEPYLPTTRH